MIEKIKITNYMGISESEVQFTKGKATVIVGPNEAGKTSLIHAVNFLLTGHALKDEIHAGRESASITAQIESVGELSRVLSAKEEKVITHLNGELISSKKAQEVIQNAFDASPETVDIMCTMSSEVMVKTKALLPYLLNLDTEQGIFKTGVTFDRILEICNFSDDAAFELENYLAPEDDSIFFLPDIEETIIHYKGLHKQISKRLEGMKKASNKKVSLKLKNRDEKTIEEEMELIFNRLCDAKGIIEGYESTKKAAYVCQAEIGRLELELSALPASKLSQSGIEKRRNELTSIKDQLKEAVNSKNQAVFKRDIWESVLKQLTEKTCPISCKLKCNTEKSVVAKEIQQNIDNALDDIIKYEQQVLRFDSKIAKTESEIEVWEKRQYLKSKIEDYKASLKSLPKKPIINETDIQALEKKHKTLSEELSSVKSLKDVTKEALEDKAGKYAEIIKQFGPDGDLFTRILEPNIKRIEETINLQISSFLPNYSLEFTLKDGDFSLYLKNAEGNRIAYDKASSSQKIKIVFGIIHALNQLNHFKVLALDQIDCLDSTSARAFLEAVEAVKDDFHNIIIATVNHDSIVDILIDFPNLSQIILSGTRMQSAS